MNLALDISIKRDTGVAKIKLILSLVLNLANFGALEDPSYRLLVPKHYVCQYLAIFKTTIRINMNV